MLSCHWPSSSVVLSTKPPDLPLSRDGAETRLAQPRRAHLIRGHRRDAGHAGQVLCRLQSQAPAPGPAHEWMHPLRSSRALLRFNPSAGKDCLVVSGAPRTGTQGRFPPGTSRLCVGAAYARTPRSRWPQPECPYSDANVVSGPARERTRVQDGVLHGVSGANSRRGLAGEARLNCLTLTQTSPGNRRF